MAFEKGDYGWIKTHIPNLFVSGPTFTVFFHRTREGSPSIE